MTEARSKRRVLPLISIVKSFNKPLLIKVQNSPTKVKIIHSSFLVAQFGGMDVEGAVKLTSVCDNDNNIYLELNRIRCGKRC